MYHLNLPFAELPAGRVAEFLVGFSNKGKQDMVLEVLDASFRYSMDYNFYMQNFSTISYQQLVKPSHESTLMYSFIPADTFAGRPFGFTVNLHYRDAVSSSSFDTKFDAEITIFGYSMILFCFKFCTGWQHVP